MLFILAFLVSLIVDYETSLWVVFQSNVCVWICVVGLIICRSLEQKGISTLESPLVLSLGFFSVEMIMVVYIIDLCLMELERKTEFVIRSKSGLFGSIMRKSRRSKWITKCRNGIRNHSLLNWITSTALFQPFLTYEAEFFCPIEKWDEALISYKKNEPIPQDVIERDVRIGNMKSGLTILSLVLIALSFSGMLLLPLTLSLLMVYLTMRMPSDKREQVVPSGKAPGSVIAPDGCYKIYCNFMTYQAYCGVGYLTLGVMHSRYHVVSGYAMKIGSGTYPPSYMSSETDYICWGGSPKFVRAENGENAYVYLVVENEMCPFFYETTIERWDNMQLNIMRGAVTKPGMSGSPVFVKRTVTEEGEGESIGHTEFYLTGLVGNNVYGEGTEYKMSGERTNQIELMMDVGMDREVGSVMVRRGEYKIVIDRTGSGKTRHVLPDLVRQMNTFSSTVIISPPTCVICAEMRKAIAEMYPTLRYSTAGRQTLSNSRVNIIPHATLLKAIMRRESWITNEASFILDESHYVDSKTMLLKEVLRERVENGMGTVVELTATAQKLDGTIEINATTNYPVVDYAVSSVEFVAKIKEVLGEGFGRKVVVFCPTVEARTCRLLSVQSIYNAIKDMPSVEVVSFHRKTMQREYGRATSDPLEGTNKVVITTNMSECGINLNADIVFDTAQQMRYVVSGRRVVSEIGSITEAQRVQRRGRVGRRKEGKYYYIARPISQGLMSENQVERVDVMICKKAMGMKERPYDIALEEFSDVVTMTGQQIKVWIGETDFSNPMTTYLFYTGTGVRRSKADEREKLRWFLTGDIPMRVKNFEMKLKWCDVRDMGVICRALKENGLMNEKYEDIIENEWEDPGPVYNIATGLEERNRMKKVVDEMIENVKKKVWLKYTDDVDEED